MYDNFTAKLFHGKVQTIRHVVTHKINNDERFNAGLHGGDAVTEEETYVPSPSDLKK